MAQVQYDLNIRDYWRVIRKRRFLILFAFIAVVVFTAVYNNLQTPIYRATATVRIQVQATVISALTERFFGPTRDVLSAEEKVITSGPIIMETAKRLKLIKENSSQQEIDNVVGEIGGGLSTQKVPEAEIIQIMLESSDPKKAKEIVNTLAQVYIEENFKSENKEVRQTREFIEQQMLQVEKRLRNAEDRMRTFKEKEVVSGVAVALTSRLADLQASLSTLLTKATEKHPDAIRLNQQIQEVQEKLKKLPSSELEYARLNRDVEIHEQLYKMLRSRFEESRITEGARIAKASIVNPATEPKTPIRPNKRFALLVGSVIGVMTSLILAFLAESMDTSIGTIEDVEETLKLPVLAVVPSYKSEVKETKTWLAKSISKKSKEEEDPLPPGLIGHFKPMSQMAEAFRILRTNLKLTGEKKALLITSAGPREGKSTILMGLAISLCQMGVKTLVLDADLRRPAIHKILGLEREAGLNEIISGEIKYEQAIKELTDIMIGKWGFDDTLKTPGLDNLGAITCGHLVSNPSELLSSPKIVQLIEDMKLWFEVILVDSPPVLSLTDAAILAPKVGTVILVYEMGRTARSALLRAKTQLESVGAKVLGVVLNHIRPETYLDSGYYPYYYHYKYKYYKADEGEEGRDSKVKEST